MINCIQFNFHQPVATAGAPSFYHSHKQAANATMTVVQKNTKKNAMTNLLNFPFNLEQMVQETENPLPDALNLQTLFKESASTYPAVVPPPNKKKLPPKKEADNTQDDYE